MGQDFLFTTNDLLRFVGTSMPLADCIDWYCSILYEKKHVRIDGINRSDFEGETERFINWLDGLIATWKTKEHNILNFHIQSLILPESLPEVIESLFLSTGKCVGAHDIGKADLYASVCDIEYIPKVMRKLRLAYEAALLSDAFDIQQIILGLYITLVDHAIRDNAKKLCEICVSLPTYVTCGFPDGELYIGILSKHNDIGVFEAVKQ